jgi:hypothetical protein
VPGFAFAAGNRNSCHRSLPNSCQESRSLTKSRNTFAFSAPLSVPQLSPCPPSICHSSALLPLQPASPVRRLNPFSTFPYFLVGSFIFEDVGVTAYSGAAPLISAASVAAGYLTAAAGILAVEAYHAAYVRISLTGGAIGTGSAAACPYITVANQVGALRATLTAGASAAPGTAGSLETPLALPTSLTTASSIVAASPTTAVGFARTVNQVLHIAYGSPTVGVAKGGFFPNGMNSIFATTTA